MAGTDSKAPTMQNVLLIIHLIVAICLISAVLLQRSEGGALGMGGGGGGLVTSRGAETALSKLTWGLAIAFLSTSILLTVLAGGREGGSVFDRMQTGGGETESIPLPDLGGDDGLLPPAAEEPGGNVEPTAPEAPATPPAAE